MTIFVKNGYRHNVCVGLYVESLASMTEEQTILCIHVEFFTVLCCLEIIICEGERERKEREQRQPMPQWNKDCFLCTI